MSFSKEDAMNFVRDCLGDNPEGLFVDSDVSTGDIMPEESDIYTNISESTPLRWDFKDCEIDMGATKLVIIPKKRNYVIKIPFTGTYYYDEETDKLIINSVIKNKDSIMKDEERIFKSSTELMQKILLENHFIGFFNDCVPIYIQRKAIPHRIATESDFGLLKTKYTTKKLCIASYLQNKYNSDLDIFFILKLITIYGVNTSISLITEMKNIDDLHSGNYGYDLNNFPVIIDYGGYDSSMWE